MRRRRPQLSSMSASDNSSMVRTSRDASGNLLYRRTTNQLKGSQRIMQHSAPSTVSEPLHSLLYRYFFFDWLFRDVSRGNLLERAAAWRANREMRRYLPVYLRRWLVIFVA